jgi:predicted DNA binding protein
MRRLILEVSTRALSKVDPARLEKIKSVEVLHFLRSDAQEIAMIGRVEFNEPNVRIEDVLRDDLIVAQLLEHEKVKENKKEREIYTYFIKVKPTQSVSGGTDFAEGGGYLSLPYEVKDGKVKVTFLGSAKQVRDFIKRFEDASIRYRVVSLTDAKFPPHSPLNRLTEKQRRVFITAHNLGYYEVPRKINLVQLAERLELAYSTVDVQLRRAERRLLSHIMSES